MKPYPSQGCSYCISSLPDPTPAHTLCPHPSSHTPRAERLTAANRGMQLTVALSYSGQQDIVTAMQRIAQQVAKGRLQPHQVRGVVHGILIGG